MKKLLLFITLLPISTQTLSEENTDLCRRILKTHGMLSRAQFQCGFRYYGTEMFESAKECSSLFSDEEKKDILSYGMGIFDANEQERGRKKLCSDMLKDFPKILKK